MTTLIRQSRRRAVSAPRGAGLAGSGLRGAAAPRLAVAALALLGGLLALGVRDAAADPPSDIVIVPQGRADADGNYEVGSRQPTIVVQANLGLAPGATEVRCVADYPTSYVDTAEPVLESCGTRVTAGCPTSQCWEYRPTFAGDGEHNVGVALMSPSGEELDFLGLNLTVDSTPPDTYLSPSPASFQSEEATRHRVPVSFYFKARDDDEASIFEDSLQCAFTAPDSTPRAWGSCRGKAMRLPISPRVYRFWVRAVDFLGRPDPTPAASAPFSPVPCRTKLVSHPHSLRQIAGRGLRVRVSCVQPIAYKVFLFMPLKETVRLNRRHHDVSSQELGRVVAGRTRREGSSRVLTLHLLRRIPHVLFALRHLSLSIETLSATDFPLYLPHVTGR